MQFLIFVVFITFGIVNCDSYYQPIMSVTPSTSTLETTVQFDGNSTLSFDENPPSFDFWQSNYGSGEFWRTEIDSVYEMQGSNPPQTLATCCDQLTSCGWGNTTNCNLHALRKIGQYMNYSIIPATPISSSILTPAATSYSAFGKMDFSGINPQCTYPGASFQGICVYMNVTYSLSPAGVLNANFFIFLIGCSQHLQNMYGYESASFLIRFCYQVHCLTPL